MYRIEINDNRTLDELQDEFGEFYPHLKMLFYSLDNNNRNIFSFDLMESRSIPLTEFRIKHNSGYLYLNDDLSVLELKNKLLNTFGIKAEIFQKIENNKWSKTPISDDQLLCSLSFEIV
jgi:hypothetical protein